MIKNQQRIEQIAGLILIGAIVVGCLLVLRPFALAILWAAILCFVTWPLRELLLKWFRGRRNLTAAMMTIVLLLVLFVPFFVVGLTFTDNLRSGMQWLETHKDTALLPPPAWVERIPFAGRKISEYWSDLTRKCRARLKPAQALVSGSRVVAAETQSRFCPGRFHPRDERADCVFSVP